MTDHPWNKVSQAAKELLERARPEGNEAPITFRRDDEGRCLLSPTPLRWGGPKGGVAAQLAKRNVPSFFSQLGEERGALVLCPDLRGLASDILLHLVGKNPLPNHPPTGESWIVEFSQPNTHKAFHVGHFRNVVTGDFLVRLARFGGHDVIAANYIGDIGTHVLRAMVGWERAGCPDPPTQGDLAKWLGGFYSEWAQKEGEACESFVSVLHQNLEELIALYPEKKELVGIKKRRLGRNRRLLMSLFQSALQGNLPWAESEAETWKACLEIQDEIATRWAQKDKALIRDWERTRAWSIDSFNEIYDALEIPFDHVWYESEVEEEAQRIGKELLERGLATEEDGAVLVDFKKEPYNEPKKDVLMLLRRDGLPLYSAKDLALARLKERMFSPDQSLYVVAVPQSLYFSQIFTILEQGDHAPKLTHLAYEMVNLPEGKMSSRSGSAIPFSDLWEDALERVGKRCRNPEGKDVPLIAQGALKHAMLSRDFNKKVLFDW
nr:arginine--tRNA ligase [bacterium]